MRELHQPIRQAQRRLWLNRWLDRLGWSVAIAAGVFVLAVVVLRALQLADDETRWLGIVALVLLGGVTAVSVALSFWGRTRAVVAAEHLDRAAGLKERISSALLCASMADEFAQAVVADARRHIGQIHVPRCIPIRCPRSASYAAGVGVLALLMFWVFPEWDLMGRQQKREEKSRQAAAMQQAVVMMKPVLEQAKKDLGEKHPELLNELDQLDPLTLAQTNNPMDLQREAMKKLDHLATQLESKRSDKNLEQVNDLKKMLRNLAAEQNGKPGPVSELSQKLSQGDFEGAQQNIEQLGRQIANAETPEQKQQVEELMKQLGQLGEKLNQMGKTSSTAEQNKKACQTQSQCNACKAASKLGNCFKQAAAGQKGSPMQSQKSLTAACQQLSKMKTMDQELKQLNSDLNKLSACKNQVGQCSGSQCNQGINVGTSPGQHGNVPQAEMTFNTQKERAVLKSLPGSVISQRYVNGEPDKGKVSEDISQIEIAAERDVSDAIARERIPRVYHESLRKYFSRHEGGQADQATPAKDSGHP